MALRTRVSMARWHPDWMGMRDEVAHASEHGAMASRLDGHVRWRCTGERAWRDSIEMRRTANEMIAQGWPNGLGISGGAPIDREGGRADSSFQKSSDLVGAKRRPLHALVRRQPVSSLLVLYAFHRLLTPKRLFLATRFIPVVCFIDLISPKPQYGILTSIGQYFELPHPIKKVIARLVFFAVDDEGTSHKSGFL